MQNDYRDITDGQIERFIPYLNGHLRLKYRTNPEQDELYSAGLEGIAEGIRRYEPDRGVPYEYWVQMYAARYVQNRAAALRRDAARCAGEVPADELADSDAAGPEEELARSEQVRLAMAALDPFEAEVIGALYLKGMTMRAAAGALGVKTDRVFRTHRRALEKMRAALGAE